MSDAVPSVPPIPRQTRHPARRKEGNAAPSPAVPTAPGPGLVRRDHRHQAAQIPPASPEVISSLITSLSNSHFDGIPVPSADPVTTAPRSPSGGSFGVDYGAFSNTHLPVANSDDTPLDELAASPPVIRTAKPPSGFSPLTAPKAESSTSGGLKSILGAGRSSASRPSSKGSLASRDADTQSIGALSIERGPVSPAPELKKKPSLDSWGKKTGRANKGLMYMSSKERLREKEAERKRASVGAVGTARLSTERTGDARQPDPFLAETPISEEPYGESPRISQQGVFDNGLPSPRPIPTRESSLRKTGPNAKRSSQRHSKRPSETDDVIHELDEHSSSSRATQRERKKQNAHDDSKMGAEVLLDTSKMAGSQRGTFWDSKGLASHLTENEDAEEGAPFPAVAQRRKRDLSTEGRRKPGRQTPDPFDAGKPRRSGSKLKRLSGPLSPGQDDRLGSMRTNGHRNSEDPGSHINYERPQSADSIDDAVESYLCSPRLSQKIRHPQTGRVISFSEVGDSDGSAVFCCVGMGLTRYITAFYDELALTLKLRLITPDRPGVGDSEPYGDGTATPLSWPGTYTMALTLTGCFNF
jgi:hypothetical protein